MMQALVVLGLSCVILVAMVLAWTVSTLATMKKQMVYTDELNGVIGRLNALTHAIHSAYVRNTDKIEQNETTIRDVEDKRKTLEDQLAEITGSVAGLQDVQQAQSNFIVQNQVSIEDLNHVVNVDTVANPDLYAKTSDLEDNYVSVQDFGASVINSLSASDVPYNLAAREISLGYDVGSSTSAGFIKYNDDNSLALSVDGGGAYLQVTNEGLKHCSVGQDGAETCSDVALSTPTPPPTPPPTPQQ